MHARKQHTTTAPWGDRRGPETIQAARRGSWPQLCARVLVRHAHTSYSTHVIRHDTHTNTRTLLVPIDDGVAILGLQRSLLGLSVV